MSLEREARALIALRGAFSIPELRALVYRRGVLCGFVTRYLPGETLDRLLEQGHSRDRALSLAVSITEAVLEILRRDFLHRDLKPQNLLLSRDGRVRILDFGLACKIFEAPEDGLSGTLAYASPEQLDAGSLDSRSDLFSLGLVLYEVATGRMFFSCDTKSYRSFMECRASQLREPLWLEGIEPQLADLVRRLVVADRRRRASVAEVSARLEKLRLTRSPRAALVG